MAQAGENEASDLALKLRLLNLEGRIAAAALILEICVMKGLAMVPEANAKQEVDDVLIAARSLDLRPGELDAAVQPIVISHLERFFARALSSAAALREAIAQANGTAAKAGSPLQ